MCVRACVCVCVRVCAYAAVLQSVVHLLSQDKSAKDAALRKIAVLFVEGLVEECQVCWSCRVSGRGARVEGF